MRAQGPSYILPPASFVMAYNQYSFASLVFLRKVRDPYCSSYSGFKGNAYTSMFQVKALIKLKIQKFCSLTRFELLFLLSFSTGINYKLIFSTGRSYRLIINYTRSAKGRLFPSNKASRSIISFHFGLRGVMFTGNNIGRL